MSDKLARIVVVTTGHLSSNPRVVKEARALAEAGYEVTVVHGDYAPWFAAEDVRLVQGFKSIAVPFGPLRAGRIIYLSQTLARRSARALAALPPLRKLCAGRAVSPVTASLRKAARSIAADLYIAHYIGALPAVTAAARMHRGQYAFDAEDFHPGELTDTPSNAFERALIETVEAPALKEAAYITAASVGIARAYAITYDLDQPTVVRNVFPLEQAPKEPTPAGSARPGPSLYWFSQTIGPNRGLECAVRALAIARSRPHLYLRGLPSQDYLEKLNIIAREEGVADRLHVLEPVPPDELERLAAQYDLGLVGETGATQNRRIALTNKQFSYLLAGIPAVMSDVPAHLDFFEEAKGAVFLYRTDNPASLASVLDTLLGDPNKLAAARARAFTLGRERFNWDREKAALLDRVGKTLERSATAPVSDR